VPIDVAIESSAIFFVAFIAIRVTWMLIDKSARPASV
jgi:hypothetical protein